MRVKGSGLWSEPSLPWCVKDQLRKKCPRKKANEKRGRERRIPESKKDGFKERGSDPLCHHWNKAEGCRSDKDSKVSIGPGHLEVTGDLCRGHQEGHGGRQTRAEEWRGGDELQPAGVAIFVFVFCFLQSLTWKRKTRKGRSRGSCILIWGNIFIFKGWEGKAGI